MTVSVVNRDTHSLSPVSIQNVDNGITQHNRSHSAMDFNSCYHCQLMVGDVFSSSTLVEQKETPRLHSSLGFNESERVEFNLIFRI